MADTLPDGDIPAQFVDFRLPLPQLATALQRDAPVRIVAIGSSSTAGRGDVVPYPHRLEMYLRSKYGEDRFPKRSFNLKIDVLNRGKGGEEAVEEILRFDADVLAENPALVIWQVGTNAVFHNYDLDLVATKIADGLERLRGRDVVLIDPQYVPAMLLDDKAEASARMVSLISAAAKQANVNLFRRWALMRHWHVHDDIALDRMFDPTDPDRLHQSDWSTRRFAQALRDAIVKGAAGAVRSADANS
jgi:hypothetical protein